MKPQEADVQWCIANRDLIARWLEGRGGWQVGDWARTEVGDMGVVVKVRRDGGLTLWIYGRGSDYCEAAWRDELVWLPSERDMLEMLEKQGIKNFDLWYHAEGEGWMVNGHFGKTRLIALMELLKGIQQ